MTKKSLARWLAAVLGAGALTMIVGGNAFATCVSVHGHTFFNDNAGDTCSSDATSVATGAGISSNSAANHGIATGVGIVSSAANGGIATGAGIVSASAANGGIATGANIVSTSANNRGIATGANVASTSANNRGVANGTNVSAASANNGGVATAANNCSTSANANVSHCP